MGSSEIDRLIAELDKVNEKFREKLRQDAEEAMVDEELPPAGPGEVQVGEGCGPRRVSPN